jgi:SpoVK/Ycf46/Vps4 family AAA+-type ATPase
MPDERKSAAPAAWKGRQGMILTKYRDAGYPVVAVESQEERRLVRQVLEEVGPDAAVMTISASGGLIDARTGACVDPQGTYPKAFDRAAEEAGLILLVFDWHHIAPNPAAYRQLLSRIPKIKRNGSIVVLIAPAWNVPPELEHELPVIPHPLPTRAELEAAVNTVKEAAALNPSADEISRLCDAASGLALEEAENAMSLATVECDRFDPEVVEREKLRLVQLTKGLAVLPRVPADQLGGMTHYRRWLTEVVSPSRHDKKLRVKAALLVGPAGTGKSMGSIVAASILGMPCVSLDLAACKGQYQGNTEGAVREALKRIDAIAPCVLRLDEMDSALGGHASSAETDGGVTLSVVSMLLTWFQDRTSDVLVLATANYPERIPPAMLRPGRLDAIWSVNLPTFQERSEIAGIHLRKLGCSDEHADWVAKLTPNYSGAEIAAVCLDTARRTVREVTRESIEISANEIIPLSKSRATEIQKMRDWARTYARPASEPEGPASGPARKIQVTRKEAN